ncbi:MAG: transposase [Candidatus Acidiferrales bacterium]
MIPVGLPSRRSLRLPDYDYRDPGVYFFTICSHGRRCTFGRIVALNMQLNHSGKIVWQCWRDLPRHFPSVQLDQFIVMPNHVHGLLALHKRSNGRAGLRPAPTVSNDKGPHLANVIGALKSFSARQINRQRGTPGTAVWQRNYFERVVRSGDELAAIQHYIDENPMRWASDRENSAVFAAIDTAPWKA